MRIDEILSKKRTLSFEVFPPKKDNDELNKVFNTIKELKEYNPDFISVTYGASGSNRNSNVEIASFIKNECNIEPLAHLTGGPSTKEEIDEITKRFKEEGIDNILALRGDKPLDYNDDYCKYFKHATDLEDYLKDKDFTIACACYPEGHIECETLYEDLVHMKEKEEKGAKFFITQIFYDNDYYYRLVFEARKIGIKAPIIPGIMPLTNPKNIKRIKQMCGSTIPLGFRNMIEIYKDKPQLLEEIGYNYAAYQIIDLIAKGAPGIHLYIMNNSKTAKEIYKRLKNVFSEMF